MAGRQFRQALSLLLAGSLIACASTDTRPDDMSAAEHRAQAARVREEAQREDAAARSGFVMIHGKGPDHAEMAGALREHAREHEAAARELLNFQAQECAGLSVDAGGQCPLLQVEGVEETSDGVILWLRPGTDVERALHLIQCYLAYGRAQAFKGDPGCPFYVRGMHVVPVEGKTAVRLVASDEAATATLQRLIRQAFAPDTTPQAETGAPHSSTIP